MISPGVLPNPRACVSCASRISYALNSSCACSRLNFWLTMYSAATVRLYEGKYMMTESVGAPTYSSSKYPRSSSGNAGSVTRLPRQLVHVSHRLCSRGSTPVSSKISSGIMPRFISTGIRGASSYQRAPRCRSSISMRVVSCSATAAGSRNCEGGRNGANAVPASRLTPGLGGLAKPPPTAWPGMVMRLPACSPLLVLNTPSAYPGEPGTMRREGALVGGMPLL
mmetsp:Transcript_1362/g.3173  ORF Transcript_1362/g.3173 Transcript_1362/m.3173 type:complete len:224 (+) Transcript_1362:1026-1697(+)